MKSLRVWFKIHFLVDILFAIPLFLFPIWTLGLFGIVSEPVLARLIGAALVGIGGVSYLTKTKQEFKILLKLKVLWSSAAIVALVWSVIEGASSLIWVLVVVFVLFFGVWWYYLKRL